VDLLSSSPSPRHLPSLLLGLGCGDGLGRGKTLEEVAAGGFIGGELGFVPQIRGGLRLGFRNEREAWWPTWGGTAVGMT
jgi:hypothetical protein